MHTKTPIVTLVVVLSLFGGCKSESKAPSREEPESLSARDALVAAGAEALEPIDQQPEALVTLGRALFFDKELSGNRDVSCATCHHPSLATIDGKRLGVGTGGSGLGPKRKLGENRDIIPRNAPDLFNRADPGFRTMFWDNRIEATETGVITSPAGGYLPRDARTMFAAQAMFPVTARDEMRGAFHDETIDGKPNEIAKIIGSQPRKIWSALMDRIMKFEGYRELFARAFPDVPEAEIAFVHAARAMAAFQSDAFHLTDSDFDRYMQGEDDALSADALAGAELFFGKAQCSACHGGRLLTDQITHNIGVPQIGPGTGNAAPLDIGRGAETGKESDRFAFRTPPLRNVELTAPYMHNGAYDTLEEAVRHHLTPREHYENYDASELPPELEGLVHNSPEVIDEVFATLDSRMASPPSLDDQEVGQLVAFLKSLTSPSARPDKLEMIVPESVPSGHEVERLASADVLLEQKVDHDE